MENPVKSQQEKGAEKKRLAVGRGRKELWKLPPTLGALTLALLEESLVGRD